MPIQPLLTCRFIPASVVLMSTITNGVPLAFLFKEPNTDDWLQLLTDIAGLSISERERTRIKVEKQV